MGFVDAGRFRTQVEGEEEECWKRVRGDRCTVSGRRLAFGALGFSFPGLLGCEYEAEKRVQRKAVTYVIREVVSDALLHS